MSSMNATTHPLAGRHIVITRPPEQAEDFARALEAAGARVTTLSTIAIEPVADTTHIDAAIATLATYDWVVLTSVNGVRVLASRLMALHRNWNARGRARVAAIGPATAQALSARGVEPDLVPSEYIAEGILEGLGNVAGQRVLLLRADIARRTLADELRLRGAEVDEISAYRTVVQPAEPDTLRRILEDDRPDAITFTSSSTVRGLVEGLQALRRDPPVALNGVALAAIGPITAGTLHEYGLAPAIVAGEYTTEGLLHALVAHFSALASSREGA